VNASAPGAEAPLTQLLQAWRHGDAGAFATLVGLVHGDLLRMAAARLRTGDGGTFSRGDLLNSALLRVMESPPEWRNRAHFFATLSLTMRSVLVDHARARLAGKRGGGQERVTWTLSSLGEESMAADLLTLDALLRQLEAEDPRAAQILQLTYFTGLQRQEVAEVLEISVPTVDRDLRFARAWLTQQLGRGLEA
jgi:RNA polymerase sigma factor (TIGR02999 family)